MDIHELLKKADSSKVSIEATVPTGLENVGVAECKEKLGEDIDICKDRGRIFFNIDISEINKVFLLRSVDNLYVITHSVKSVGTYCGEKETDLQLIKNLATCPDWKESLSIWRKVCSFQGICYPSQEEYGRAMEEERIIKSKVALMLNSMDMKGSDKDGNSNTIACVKVANPLSEDDVSDGIIKDTKGFANQKCEARKCYQQIDKRNNSCKVLKYRVTCYRVGDHTFGSQDAAYHFGGQLQDMFSWIVDLVHFDLEIVLNIKGEEAYVGIALTKESMHRRNIKQFGPTTLRATVCYGLLHLGEPKVGDIVIDPMCGGGSIPIEGALTFPGSFYIGGDFHPKAVSRSSVNVDALVSKRKNTIDLLSWDVRKLPLRDSSVDVFVTDLPFGKRSGSKQDNRTLYKDALVELARVVRQDSGRAVLLTQDRKNLTRTLTQTHKLWSLAKIVGVNIGGLDAAIYVLNRTCNEALSIYNYISKVLKHKKRKVS
ncbi:tRNA (guanine(6)-N2)-methyltransferase THUMP3 [Anabrus simplex]|uniref:tRNA (guanine(6)-N2)-methyltransferase THUMP3 n=1 Tax=Anabrus simplex TaxID=316456 RepID=UPI0035A2E4A8